MTSVILCGCLFQILVASECLIKQITTLLYLARQGLPIRGHEDFEGNFKQVLRLRSQDCPHLMKRLEKKLHGLPQKFRMKSLIWQREK